MILKVSRLGHPVLRMKSEDVKREDVRAGAYAPLIDDMFETMEAYQGVGLAAPQVHLPIRLFVYELPPDVARRRKAKPVARGALFNARLELVGKPDVVDYEGCLSVPFLGGEVPRYPKVILRGLDQKADDAEIVMEDYAARIFQHEVDHLDGKVYLDRMPDLTTLGYTIVL